MSLNLKQNVKCPKCSQMSEVTVWNSITVKDSEDLKHDLLTGKVNMFRSLVRTRHLCLHLCFITMKISVL